MPIILPESGSTTATAGLDANAIVTAVINQGGTDASRTVVLSLLNEVYAQQVADSRWLRSIASIGTTVAGDTTYALPADIVESYGLKVGDSSFELVGEDTMWELASGSRYGRSVYSQGYDDDGNVIVNIWPAPETAGEDITIYAARLPSPLTDSSTSFPVTPPDSHSSLIDGTLALVLQRIDEREDLAAPRWATFLAVTEKIRRRKHSLLRGSRPAVFRVEGVHWR